MADHITSDANSLKLLSFLVDKHIPFAVYRMPLEEKITLLIQYSSKPKEIHDIQNLDKESGFIMAPFPGKGNYPICLLQPDKILDLNNLSSDIVEEINDACYYAGSSKIDLPSETTQDDYESHVKTAVEAMKRRDFFKVVLSRVQVEELKNRPEYAEMYLNSCMQYPRAMAYMVYMPQTGLWMGATPEPVLVSKEGRLRTVSLAGTQLLGDRKLDQVQWGEKEIAEQAIVSRFIVKLIDNLGISNYDIKGPGNFQAGALVHLNTEFSFDAAELHIRLGEFMDALHPTPSICGLPRDPSLKFILEYEKHERGYYSGMLGPVNLNKETQLYVNLRCMRLEDDKAVMYSGAGLTESSDPNSEWVETSNKLQTVKKVLHV